MGLRTVSSKPRSGSKIKTLGELKPIVQGIQGEGRTVVWTNGCFDILHAGHVTYLIEAARQGDILIVGLNSDASVREVKGPGRPINTEAHRALVLSALECTGYVTVFSGESPLPLLDELRPDVYAKGGDYDLDTIHQEERRFVEGYGGTICIVPGVEGLSTTGIIDRMGRSKA